MHPKKYKNESLADDVYSEKHEIENLVGINNSLLKVVEILDSLASDFRKYNKENSLTYQDMDEEEVASQHIDSPEHVHDEESKLSETQSYEKDVSSYKYRPHTSHSIRYTDINHVVDRLYTLHKDSRTKNWSEIHEIEKELTKRNIISPRF